MRNCGQAKALSSGDQEAGEMVWPAGYLDYQRSVCPNGPDEIGTRDVCCRETAHFREALHGIHTGLTKERRCKLLDAVVQGTPEGPEQDTLKAIEIREQVWCRGQPRKLAEFALPQEAKASDQQRFDRPRGFVEPKATRDRHCVWIGARDLEQQQGAYVRGDVAASQERPPWWVSGNGRTGLQHSPLVD